MRTNFYELMKSWTSQPWNRKQIETTLDYIAAAFFDKEVAFLLIDDITDWLEEIDGPFGLGSPKQKQQRFKIFLDDEKISKVSKNLELEVKQSPELKVTVLEIDEMITNHPEWFEKYKPMSLDEVAENLRKAMEEKEEK